MTDIRNFIDAAGEKVQPYFAAFMVERGFATIKEATKPNCVEYMLWNGARWREFSKLHGFDDYQRRYHAEAFLNWLVERSLDQQARQFVEAA